MYTCPLKVGLTLGCELALFTRDGMCVLGAGTVEQRFVVPLQAWREFKPRDPRVAWRNINDIVCNLINVTARATRPPPVLHKYRGPR
jgi:hypothetical protein